MKQIIRTPFSRLGFARRASDYLLALALIFLLPGLLSAQTLVHRYSFVSDASDSVGGANGVLMPGSSGTAPATINNGLMLPGNAGGGNGVSGYVALPAGLVLGYSNITVECWVQPTSVNTWAEIWDFGTSGSTNFALIQDSGNNPIDMRVAFTPHGNEVDIDAPAVLPVSAAPTYVAVTYNDTTLVADLYTNAILDGTVTLPNTTYSPGVYGGARGTTNNSFGNDVYGDPQFGGAIYEVRIWNGVVSQRYIGAANLLGPSVIPSNLTPTNATLTVTTNMVLTGTQTGSITVQMAETGTNVILATGDATNWTSSNPNVLQVNSNGLVTAVGVGTATVSAQIGAFTVTSVSITTAPQMLEHRYSFVSDATDSVGGANGTLVAPTGATGAAATINNGLYLPGNTVGGFGYSGYLLLPPGLLTNTTSITVECWLTENAPVTWAEAWDFGNNGSQNFALIPYPANNNHDMSVALTPNGNEHDLATTSLFPTNTEQYVCLTYNNSSLTGNLYTNGAIDATTQFPSTFYCPGAIGGATGTVSNMLGNDVYGDDQFDGVIYEFRIWNGALSPLYAAVAGAAGPNVIVTNLTPSGLTLAYPSNSIIGTQTEPATITGNFTTASGVTVTDAATNWLSSNTNVLTVNSSGVVTAITFGTATVTATVNGVNVTSQTINVSESKPLITQEPVGDTTVVGEPATFTVVAVGGSLSYQWEENGIPISGATNSTFTIANPGLTNAGSYSVLVSNSLGSTNSTAVPFSVETAILAHRYSFVSNADDSIGNANGTLMPGSSGTAPATIDNGLILPGNPGGGNGVSGYVALPDGIVLGDDSVSVECWVQPSSVNTWAEIWDFGSSGTQNFALIQDSPGPGNMRVAFTPHGNEVDIMAPTYLPAGPEAYVAVTYNNATLVGDLYTNGILDASVTLPDTTYSPGTYGAPQGTTDNSFGNDVFGDPQFGGAIYEVRIWNGVISPLYISLATILGPSTLVTNLTPNALAVTVTNSTLSVGETEQVTVTGTFAQTTNAVIPLTGSVSNWTSSATNILAVNASGQITAVGVGAATISANVNGEVSSTATITVVGAPAITQEPPATEVLLAGATFSASATSEGVTPLTYYWYFNNNANPISSGASATLTIPNIGAGNAGNYTLIASNAYGTATSTPVTLTVVSPTPYQANLLALGPLGYWPLDETSGTVAYDLVGGDNGAYVGNVAFGQPGPTNASFGTTSYGVGFDGQTTYVDIPEGPFNLTNAVTCMAWVQAPYAIQFAGLIGHGDASWRTSINPSGEPGGNDGNLGSADATSPTSIDDDNWHFVVYTYDGTLTGQNGILYVDGAQVASDSITARPPGDALDVWIAGAPDYGTARLLLANIAQAAVFNKALSAGDVAALYSGQVILGIEHSGANITLTWSSGGALLQAPSLLGPWTTNTTAVSPYTVPATNTSEFYKIQ